MDESVMEPRSSRARILELEAEVEQWRRAAKADNDRWHASQAEVKRLRAMLLDIDPARVSLKDRRLSFLEAWLEELARIRALEGTSDE